MDRDICYREVSYFVCPFRTQTFRKLIGIWEFRSQPTDFAIKPRNFTKFHGEFRQRACFNIHLQVLIRNFSHFGCHQGCVDFEFFKIDIYGFGCCGFIELCEYHCYVLLLIVCYVKREVLKSYQVKELAI